jgi:hypothetical protein
MQRYTSLGRTVKSHKNYLIPRRLAFIFRTMSGNVIYIKKQHRDIKHSKLHSIKLSIVDKFGIWASVLCSIHCFLVPVIAIFFPFLEGVFGHTFFHAFAAIFIVPLGLFAFIHGYRHHHSKQIFLLGLAGLCTILAGLQFHEHQLQHSHFHISLENVITVIGSTLLVTAHLMNLKKLKGHCQHSLI